MPVQFTSIYEALCADCPTVQLTPAWSFVPPDADCLRIMDPEERFAAIRQQSSEADLLLSGVAIRGDEGALAPNPMLLSDEGQIIVLRNGSNTIFDILTGRGCLSGAVPVLSMHKDRKVANRLGSSNLRALLATFTLADTILLRSLGVAAAPAIGLERLSLAELQRLLTLIDSRAHGVLTREYRPLPVDDPEDVYTNYLGPAEDRPGKFSLVLLAGSIVSLDRILPAGLDTVARHLTNAQSYLDVHLDGLHVWWPSVTDLANLDFRRQLQSAALLQQFLGAQQGLYRVQEFAAGRPPQSPHPAAQCLHLIKQILELRNHWDDSTWHKEELRRVLAQYEALVERQMVLPLVRDALAQIDPRVRAIQMQLAHVTGLLQRMMPELHAAVAEGMDRRPEADRGLLPAGSLKQIESLTNSMLRLSKELNRD